MKNGQLRVIGGGADLQVDVRGVSFEVWIRCSGKDWEWSSRLTYDDQAEPCGDVAETWAAALRDALRACDGMAPFRKYERGSK